MKKILFFIFLSLILIANVTAVTVTQSTDLAQTNSAGETMALGRGAYFTANSNITLKIVTIYDGSIASSIGIYYNNKTGIVNASVVSKNATFNLPLIKGQSYYICQLSQTQSAWATSATFPYNREYVNFTTGGINCGNGYSEEASINREIRSITVEPTSAGSITPNITLTSPVNNSNQLYPTTFIVTSNSSNSTFRLTNLTFFVDDSLNETISINGTSNITTFTKYLSIGNAHNWTAYVCDNFNCSLIAENKTFTTQKVYEESQSYNTQGLEGSSQTFYLNVSKSAGYTISQINLTYNNTVYSASFSAYNSSLYQTSKQISLPFISAITNKTFNWTILLTDGTTHYITSRNQTILNLGIDNCSVNNLTILNFTLANEKTQSYLNATGDNTSIKIDVNLYSDIGKTLLANTYHGFYNQSLPAKVCVSSELGTTQFYMDAQVEYTASSYQIEFYNIQGYNLNATANPLQNITLYDLLTTEAQAFKIIYRDSAFIPVSDAIIQIQRKYVDEGVFKTVEQPITDSAGQTIGNLVLNTVPYNFIVMKNGVVLSTFNNYFANCQNPLITSCEINLNAFSSTTTTTNFTEISDFLYSLTYDNNTRTITTTFTIPSGTVAEVWLNVTTEDAMGTEVCSNYITTSGGSISCVIPNTFGNSTVMANLYKNGVWIGGGAISLAQTPGQVYGGFVIFLAVLVFLTLVGAGISDNPIITVVFFAVGVITLIALNLVKGTIGVGATVLFLIVGIVILMIKAGKRT